MKLTELLKEIKVNPPGRTILWGMDDQGYFTELVKLKGFSTAQEALDEINKAFPDEDPYHLDEDAKTVSNPSYIYLANDGEAFPSAKDLSAFDEMYQTEESWKVAEWSKNPPR